jgi:hypothetical protein
MDDATPLVKRIRLAGKRFDGGRLPVDSLIELERYQSLLRTMARAEWQQEHPGQSVPEGFAAEVSLTIEAIKPGSADVYLAFEQRAAYVQYQEDAQSAVDAALSAAYSNRDLPALPPAVSDEIRVGLAEIGSTLVAGQSFEVYVDGPETAPVVVNVETRMRAIEHLQLDGFMLTTDLADTGNSLVKADDVVAGRITELDAEKMKFRFESLRYGPMNGSYKTHPELLADFRAVLDSAAQGPVTRVVGVLQYKNGVPWRITETTELELFSVDNDTWGTHLIRFASLPPGWGDDGAGAPVTFTALDAVIEVMLALDQAERTAPGLFPTERGGVLIEWSSLSGVRSIEVTPDGSFELFSLSAGSFEGTHRDVEDLQTAIRFAVGVSA